MEALSESELGHLRAVARRVARRSGLGDALSEDVAQRTLLALIESPRPVSAHSSWVYTVARRTSFRVARQQRETSNAIPEQAARWVDSEACIDVQRVVARLPSVSREVLARRAFRDMSIAEIARDTGLSPSTVKLRLANVRQRMTLANLGQT